jgi:hypothetical protein
VQGHEEAASPSGSDKEFHVKVRDLITALQLHDLDMEVVVPADPSIRGDFALISLVAADVFVPSQCAAGTLEFAELSDKGAFTAVQLCGTGR